MLPDNPFAELNQLISSVHSNNNDEGPAFEYPEVINDPYHGSNSRSLSETQYKDNVQHHISGLKGTYRGNNPRIIEEKSDHNGYSKKSYQTTNIYSNKGSSNQHYREHSKGKVYSFGKSMSTIPFSYVKSDNYRQEEPSVLEQLARNHIQEGHPVRLSDTGSVSVQQKSSAYTEPAHHPNQVSL